MDKLLALSRETGVPTGEGISIGRLGPESGGGCGGNREGALWALCVDGIDDCDERTLLVNDSLLKLEPVTISLNRNTAAKPDINHMIVRS